jgi:2-aminoadipate transaminase
MHLALARPELISLAAGFVDQQTLPLKSTAEAIDAVLADPQVARAALQYGTTPGLAELREAVLSRLVAADGATAAEMQLSVDNVVLTAGSNQLLHLLTEILLDPGDIVLCAAPTYFVFLGLLAGAGARAMGVAADEQGLIPAALEEQLERLQAAGELPRVKALYVTSYYDNPSNVTLPAARRAEIIEIVKRWSRNAPIYVIEDAAYRELRYGQADVPSLRSFDEDGSTVIVAETFSKSFSPGLRVGWGVLPPALVDPVCELKGNIDFGSACFNQHVMAAVLRRGLFEPQVQLLRTQYQTKLAAMLSAADEHLAPLAGVRWNVPHGGLYIWLLLPEWLDAGIDAPLFNRALAAGVLYVPGEYCFPAEGMPRESHTIRLSFGVQSAARLRDGVAALAGAIRELHTDPARPRIN